MFYIRTDANNIVASGHLMRCLSIAKALRMKGEDTTFLTSDDYAEDIIQHEGFSQVVLHTRWNEMEEELPVLEQIIQKMGISMILVDSYQVTTGYLDTLQKLVKTIYMDDLAKQMYPVNVLVNYSFSYPIEYYNKMYQDNNIELMLGSQYVPLCEEFWNMEPSELNGQISNVLITTGGSDPYAVEEMLVKRMMQGRWKKLNFHVVIGPFSNSEERLSELTGAESNICLYHHVTHMEKLMKKCDIAISAAGSTLYELCACGIPTICFAFADNQLPGMKGMAQHNLVIEAGDIRKMSQSEFVLKIADGMEYLKEKEVRLEYRNRMRKVTDGCGAIRLAEAFMDKASRKQEAER